MQRKEEERRKAEDEKRKARQQPEDWRSRDNQSNQPPPPKVFNENPRANRGPPVQAVERDWGALRTGTGERPAVPPSQPRIIRNLDNNDNRINNKPINREERDFANLRQPIRKEKDFSSLRRDDQSAPIVQAPTSNADQIDDWRKGAPRKKDENKDPRSNLPPPALRKMPQQNEERDFSNLRRDRDSNVAPRGGDRLIQRTDPPKRNTDDDWRKGDRPIQRAVPPKRSTDDWRKGDDKRG